MEGRKFNFMLDPWAKGKLVPFGKTGKEIGESLIIPVTFVVEEVLPTGKTTVHEISHDSLETKEQPFVKQGKATVRGKVSGNATFEGFFELDKGTARYGGRILDPGTLTKNPLRFGVRLTFPTMYKNVKKDEKNDAKAFAKRLKEDRFTFVWTDGKRAKLEGGDKVSPDAKAANGPGIAEFKAVLGAYAGKSFEFTAPPDSKMLVWARQEQQFHEGFTVTWYPDPAKDPDAKARFVIDVK